MKKKHRKKLQKKIEKKLERTLEPTHAGGVVCRYVDGTLEFLLVTAREEPKRWVFPKGHIEKDETPKQTAKREVREESGVKGKVIRRLGDATLRSKGELKRVRFFLMHSTGKGPRLSVSEEGRNVEWLDATTARKRLSYKALKQLLGGAVDLLSAGLEELS